VFEGLAVRPRHNKAGLIAKALTSSWEITEGVSGGAVVVTDYIGLSGVAAEGHCLVPQMLASNPVSPSG
jgi:hypothetical protein